MIKELAEPLEDDIINNLKIGDMDHVRRR